ncbi:MAG: helicase HerA-like domain-containing protein [Candidatus Methylacidiphilales bacterium]|nr:helicase HerA-like domain-containing protein [Candidatus Methylacidiphilales bacterium]
MIDAPSILLGGSNPQDQARLALRMANRHGLIAGATGTGKTVTLQSLAESFSRAGVPVFAADVKGDLSGIARPGSPSPRLTERRQALGLPDADFRGCPVVFWDLDGKNGHPVRTTITEMGPLLLGRLLELSEAQEDALHILFKLADDQGMLVLDLKDLNALCGWATENAASLKADYGNLSTTTLASLQRKLVVLGDQGGDTFFGEPALEVPSLIREDMSGQGLVHILDARKLIQEPRRYATFMLWLLSELFEDLEEVGDRDKPRLVFFFDEAHLLFQDAPPALVQKIEQVVRLVRSKGVGIYFVTQNPLDLPDSVLGQLGNRVQHALRAFSARDQKAVKAAAETFPLADGLDIGSAITQLGVGEALVSCLDEKGSPTPTRRILIAPPESRIGPVDDAERQAQIGRSPYGTQYNTAIDRESAYERLKSKSASAPLTQAPTGAEPDLQEALGGSVATRRPSPASAPRSAEPRTPARRSDTMIEAVGKSVLRSAGSTIGREIVRGVLGSLLGGGRRRR